MRQPLVSLTEAKETEREKVDRVFNKEDAEQGKVDGALDEETEPNKVDEALDVEGEGRENVKKPSDREEEEGGERAGETKDFERLCLAMERKFVHEVYEEFADGINQLTNENRWDLLKCVRSLSVVDTSIYRVGN